MHEYASETQNDADTKADTNDECVVCYELTTDRLSCGHVLCNVCHDKWFTTHSRCPVCRARTIDIEKSSDTQSDDNTLRFQSILLQYSEELDVSRYLPRFDIWLANELLFRTSDLTLNTNQYGYFRKMKSIPLCYDYDICRYGLRVVGKSTTRSARLLAATFVSRIHSWHVGDIISHINGRRCDDTTTLSEFQNTRRYTVCHILDRTIFERLLED